jgi:uncharacterized membrane protein YgcG
MKSKIYLLIIVAANLLFLSSCYSPKFMVDDDVYVLKSNSLPIGESLNDESSYSNYRKNRANRTVSPSIYDDNFSIRDRFHRDNWMFGFGYSYYNRPNYWQNSYRPSWGYPYSPYMSMGYSNWFYFNDPFIYEYGFYPTAYSPYYYGGNYGYGNSYGYYNGSNYANGYSNNNGGFISGSTNNHSGPRGTIGGFGNPGNRLEGNTLKSIQINNPNSGIAYERPINSRKVENTAVIGQNAQPSRESNMIHSTSVGRKEINYTPTEDRGIRTPSSVSNSRSNSSRPSATQSPARQIDFRENSGGGRIESPSRPSGGNSPSNNGGRSGGSPASNSGRRN